MQDIVFTGARSLRTIQYITASLEGRLVFSRPNVVVGVTADYDTLFQRYRERDRGPGDSEMSEGAFRALIAGERSRGLDEILSVADHTIANNHSDQERFLDETRVLIDRELQLERFYEQDDHRDYPRQGGERW